MSIKRTSGNKASRRGMSTDKFPNRKGLLKVNTIEVPEDNESIDIDLTSSGNFTAGKIRLVRNGESVTVILTEQATHTSLGSPESATGLIPLRFQPAVAVFNVATSTSSQIHRLDVFSDGRFRINYLDSSFSSVSRTNSNGTGQSIGYVIDPTKYEPSQPKIQSIEEIIESSFFDLQNDNIVYKNLASPISFLANATETVIPNTSINLEAGTYFLEGVGIAAVTKDPDYSRASVQFRFVDESETPISRAFTDHIPVGENGLNTRVTTPFSEVLSNWPGGNIQMTVFLETIGGTVPNRRVDYISMKITKLR